MASRLGAGRLNPTTNVSVISRRFASTGCPSLAISGSRPAWGRGSAFARREFRLPYTGSMSFAMNLTSDHGLSGYAAEAVP